MKYWKIPFLHLSPCKMILLSFTVEECAISMCGGVYVVAVEQPQGSLYMFGSIVKALRTFCTKTTHLTSQSFVPEV